MCLGILTLSLKQLIIVTDHTLSMSTFSTLGLSNMGNTCFLNSAMQCFMHLPEVVTYFVTPTKSPGAEPNYMSDLNRNNHEHVLVQQLGKLMQAMCSPPGELSTIRPESFVRCLIQAKFADKFTGSRQHDSHELLLHVMNLLHEGIRYSVSIKINGEPVNDHQKLIQEAYQRWVGTYENDYSFMIDTFYGQTHATTQCPKCDFVSHVFEPFCYLIPEIPQHSDQNHPVTLYDCLSRYSSSETLDNQNEWKCDKCHQDVQAYRKIDLWRTPQILIVTLKRFVGYGKQMRKDNRLIDFPLDGLDIGQYVKGAVHNDSTIYDLWAVSNHMGGTSGGHYTASIRRDKGDWYYFDDNKVAKIDDSRKVVNPMAYILFYRRRTQTTF